MKKVLFHLAGIACMSGIIWMMIIAVLTSPEW